MSGDATFEQGGEQAIRLRAESSEDLTVISSLVQDAVGKVGNVHYAPRRRRLSLLLYRFRWEDKARADREKRSYERVAAALTIDDCIRVRAAGIEPRDKNKVLNLLSMTFEAGEDGMGLLTLTGSGGVTLQAQVECVNVGLVDLTRPWAAGGTPQHFE
jgi:hypothetical protein